MPNPKSFKSHRSSNDDDDAEESFDMLTQKEVQVLKEQDIPPIGMSVIKSNPLLRSSGSTPSRMTAYNYFDSPFSTPSLASTSTSSDTDHRLSHIERKFDSILKRLKRPEPKSKQQVDPLFVTESGVNLLDIEATDPSKYNLTLMDTLFTDDELS
uniref:Uncharacterized protein n=1 Tax=Amphimedon queenslandica TaxID=400682 RepID=A0A1X7UEV4_AMPQE